MFPATLRNSSVYEAYPRIDIPSTSYQTNNKYKNFPPLMHDGRSVNAAWQPGAFVDEAIRADNQITSNWQYRRYLTKHAEEIKSHNFKQACNDVGYYVRNENKEYDRSKQFRTPHMYSDIQEPVKHFDASTSDLKDLYLTKEQLQARQVVPSITQAELMKNWGTYIQKTPSVTKS